MAVVPDPRPAGPVRASSPVTPWWCGRPPRKAHESPTPSATASARASAGGGWRRANRHGRSGRGIAQLREVLAEAEAEHDVISRVTGLLYCGMRWRTRVTRRGPDRRRGGHRVRHGTRRCRTSVLCTSSLMLAHLAAGDVGGMECERAAWSHLSSSRADISQQRPHRSSGPSVAMISRTHAREQTMPCRRRRLVSGVGTDDTCSHRDRRRRRRNKLDRTPMMHLRERRHRRISGSFRTSSKFLAGWPATTAATAKQPGSSVRPTACAGARARSVRSTSGIRSVGGGASECAGRQRL